MYVTMSTTSHSGSFIDLDYWNCDSPQSNNLSCIVEMTRNSENNTNCHFGAFQQMWLTGRTLYKVVVREYVMTCTEWQQNALHQLIEKVDGLLPVHERHNY